MYNFSNEQTRSIKSLNKQLPNARLSWPFWVSVPNKMTQISISFRTSRGRTVITFDEDDLDDEHLTGRIADSIREVLRVA
jgi:hypothetical protein